MNLINLFINQGIREESGLIKVTINELAEKLASETDLLIAKMDSTANEHSSLNVTEFPTIKFYKPGSKSSPDTYTGERTLEALQNYLEEQIGRKLGETKAEDL